MSKIVNRLIKSYLFEDKIKLEYDASNGEEDRENARIIPYQYIEEEEEIRVLQKRRCC